MNMSTVDARDDFSDLINRVAYGKERIILTRRNQQLAAVVPVEDVQLIEELEDRIDLEEARRALSDSTQDRTPWEQVKAELGL